MAINNSHTTTTSNTSTTSTPTTPTTPGGTKLQMFKNFFKYDKRNVMSLCEIFNMLLFYLQLNALFDKLKLIDNNNVNNEIVLRYFYTININLFFNCCFLKFIEDCTTTALEIYK